MEVLAWAEKALEETKNFGLAEKREMGLPLFPNWEGKQGEKLEHTAMVFDDELGIMLEM